MTTIAAVKRRGIVALAADGIETWGDSIRSIRRQKIFRLPDDAVAAVAGNALSLNFLSSYQGAGDPASFIRSARTWFEEAGYKPSEQDGGTRSWGQLWLLADSTGELFDIHSDLACSRVEEDWPLSIGSGSEFAEGAMVYAALDPLLEAPEIVLAGLAAAQQRDVWTGGELMLAMRGRQNYGPDWWPR